MNYSSRFISESDLPIYDETADVLAAYGAEDAARGGYFTVTAPEPFDSSSLPGETVPYGVTAPAATDYAADEIGMTAADLEWWAHETFSEYRD